MIAPTKILGTFLNKVSGHIQIWCSFGKKSFLKENKIFCCFGDEFVGFGGQFEEAKCRPQGQVGGGGRGEKTSQRRTKKGQRCQSGIKDETQRLQGKIRGTKS